MKFNLKMLLLVTAMALGGQAVYAADTAMDDTTAVTRGDGFDAVKAIDAGGEEEVLSSEELFRLLKIHINELSLVLIHANVNQEIIGRCINFLKMHHSKQESLADFLVADPFVSELNRVCIETSPARMCELLTNIIETIKRLRSLTAGIIGR